MGGVARVLALMAVTLLVASAASAAIVPIDSPSGGIGSGAIDRTGMAAHYLVFATQPDGSVKVVFSKRVHLRGPLKSRAAGRQRGVRRDSDEIQVRLQTAGQAVVFEDTVAVPRWVRGEFHGEGPGPSGEYAIDGHFVPERSSAFVVRVPDVPGTTLTLSSVALQAEARFDIDALGALEGVTSLQEIVSSAAPLPGWDNGSPANRLDILIMGDGYSATQQGKFNNDARSLATRFFTLSPYAEYRNYANVTALFTASAKSGVNQPAYNPSCNQNARVQTCCSDPDAIGTTPKTVANAFGATFCSYTIQRLATVDNALVYIAAAAQPDWDEIMVIINSSTYGGSGGTLIVASTDPNVVGVMQHEFGHTFMHLADEYTTPAPGHSPCSDLLGTTRTCEPNVTDQTSRPLVKWLRWIDPGQSVPSSGPPPVTTAAGLWEGARYLTKGMYRQGYACIMGTLNTPFCDVAAETFPLTLYGGGWGVPAEGIDNIEPGSEVPEPGEVKASYPGGSYQAIVLGPQTGPRVTAEWFVDGVLIRTESLVTGATASHALAATAGSHTLELRVTDNSPVIHPTMRATVASNRTWDVTVAKADTTTAISAVFPSPSASGSPISVVASALASPGSGTPSGTITVSDGSAKCVIILPASSCSFTPSGLGLKTLIATYGGDANFNGSVSPGVAHTVVEPGLTPLLQRVMSRRLHGGAGTFDLPLSLLPTNPTTEPRLGPSQTIVFTFDRQITTAVATVTEGAATASAPVFTGNDVIVGLSGVNNQQYVTVTLAGIGSSDGGVGGSASVRVGLLAGDVNQNRVVTLSDLALLNAQLAQPVTPTNYLKDVNASGTLSVADKALTSSELTKALPAP